MYHLTYLKMYKIHIMITIMKNLMYIHTFNQVIFIIIKHIIHYHWLLIMVQNIY